jgi:flagellar hook-basal body complex protein FliE
MVDPIQSNAINPLSPAAPAGAVQPTPGDSKSFMDVLMNSLDEVNRLQTEADEGVKALYSGQTDDVAGVLTAVNKAGLAFDLLMEIRNKLTEAYRDIEQIRV